MYIIKNALKCIGRSKVRNILIGVIVLVIAVSSCIGLSIRQATEKAKEDTLGGLTVTASISFDRQSTMSQMRNGGMADSGGKSFDREQFSAIMGEASSLSLDEYLKYAQAESVKDFYYTRSVSVNGTDSFSPVSAEAVSDIAPENPELSGGGKGGMMGGGYSADDFIIIGYSSEAAMTSFVNGTAAITEGTVFGEGTENPDCIISEELAVFNGISVGDTVTITNPDNEEEIYTLSVVGIYSDSSANESVFGSSRMFASDPANQIYMSSAALESILDASVTLNEGAADGEQTAALSDTLSGTYVFADTDAYYQFEEDVRTLGLDSSYTVSSADVSAYEKSLTPLNTLSSMAGGFLIVILAIGAVILVVLNIFNVRERKYEIGVLTAMGMSKGKVAAQFLTEIFTVTLAAVILGAAIGTVSSIPVTNALLENQVEAQTSQANQIEQNFGRETKNAAAGKMGDSPFFGEDVNYVSEVGSATDLTVICQMLVIAVALTLLSGAVSVLFIMRYEPLKILANRD